MALLPPMRFTVAAALRSVGAPNGQSSKARRCWWNCEVSQASMVA